MPADEDRPAPSSRRSRRPLGPGGSAVADPGPPRQADGQDGEETAAPAGTAEPADDVGELEADRPSPTGGATPQPPFPEARTVPAPSAEDPRAGQAAEEAPAEPGPAAAPFDAAHDGTAGPASPAPGVPGPRTGSSEEPPDPAAAADAVSPEGAPGETTPREAGSARFTLHLDNFEGPFDLLLQLISRHKLDVTEVALSRVTDEFMAHLRALGPDGDLDQTTEFLVVAATLLDLKTARLLPTAEVEDEADLALLEARDLLFARLLQYRAYKEIAGLFADRLDDEARRRPRTVGLEPHHAELLPEVVIGIGPERFAEIAARAMRPRPRPEVYVDHIHAPLVSVREQAEVVVERLRASGELRFAELAADAPDTLTVVARFLALLELYRERAVALEQPEALGELTVRWSGGEDGRPLVTDEFDSGPHSSGKESA